MINKYKSITINNKTVPEHRFLVEKALGRKLKKTEQIHHKNHIKYDNRIENLEVIDIREHGRKHSVEYWEKHKFIPTEKKFCVICEGEILYNSKFGRKWFEKAKCCSIFCAIKLARTHRKYLNKNYKNKGGTK